MSSYDDHPGINISTLKEAHALSPLHYRHRIQHQRTDTDAFQFGRLVHCAVLEPEQVAYRYKVRPDVDGRTKAGKAALAELAARPGELVSGDWYETALAIRVALERDPVASRHLNFRAVERPMYWTDAETRASCKGRIDAWNQYGIIGLKTTRKIALHAFSREAANFCYHLQWAFYHDGWLAEHGDDLPMYEIVVESTPPHDVVVYQIPEDVLDAGREAYREALVRVLEGRQTGVWRGVANGVELVFQLPKWAQPSDDDDLTGLDFT